MSTYNDRFRVGDRVTIYPRGKKRIYCADFWHDGRHQRISLETRNKKVATQRAVRIDGDLTSGKHSAPPPPTRIALGIGKYIDYLKSENRARKTIVRYQGELNTFCEFCESRRATNSCRLPFCCSTSTEPIATRSTPNSPCTMNRWS